MNNAPDPGRHSRGIAALVAWLALVAVAGAAWWATGSEAAVDGDLIPGFALVGLGAGTWAAVTGAGWCAEHLRLPPVGGRVLIGLMTVSAVSMLAVSAGAVWLAASVIA